MIEQTASPIAQLLVGKSKSKQEAGATDGDGSFSKEVDALNSATQDEEGAEAVPASAGQDTQTEDVALVQPLASPIDVSVLEQDDFVTDADMQSEQAIDVEATAIKSSPRISDSSKDDPELPEVVVDAPGADIDVTAIDVETQKVPRAPAVEQPQATDLKQKPAEVLQANQVKVTEVNSPTSSTPEIAAEAKLMPADQKSLASPNVSNSRGPKDAVSNAKSEISNPKADSQNRPLIVEHAHQSKDVLSTEHEDLSGPKMKDPDPNLTEFRDRRVEVQIPAKIGTANNSLSPPVVSVAPADVSIGTNMETMLDMEVQRLGDPVGGKERLFQQIVSSSGTQLNSTIPARHIMNQVSAGLAKGQDGTFEIRLSPMELGRITIQIAETNGVHAATVSAERAEVLDLLRRNENLIETEFEEAGFTDLTFEFNDQNQPDHKNSDDVPRYQMESLATAEPIRMIAPVLQAERVTTDLDIRL